MTAMLQKPFCRVWKWKYSCRTRPPWLAAHRCMTLQATYLYCEKLQGSEVSCMPCHQLLLQILLILNNLTLSSDFVVSYCSFFNYSELWGPVVAWLWTHIHHITRSSWIWVESKNKNGLSMSTQLQSFNILTFCFIDLWWSWLQVLQIDGFFTREERPSQSLQSGLLASQWNKLNIISTAPHLWWFS